jgi:hypothetical protein
MVDVCPFRSSTHPHVSPRSGTLHSFQRRSGFLIGWRFPTRQRSVGQQLLPQTQRGSTGGVMAQLVGDPLRERNIEAVNDGQNIIRQPRTPRVLVQSLRSKSNSPIDECWCSVGLAEPRAVFAGDVEVEPAVLYGFAVGVFPCAFRRWWWARWGLGFGPGLRDWSAVFVGERHPINLVGVTGDSEFALVMQTVMMRTQRNQIPCIGWAVVFPVDDVMYFDELVLRAAVYSAAAVAELNDAAGAFGNDPLGAPD